MALNTELPARYELFRTQDLDEAREKVAGILSPHRLTAGHQRGAFDVRYQYVCLGDTSVMYAEYGDDIVIDPGILESYYLVGMPLSGTTRVHYDGEEIWSSPGYASVQSPTRSLRTAWLGGCRKITVKIGRQALELHLTRLLGHPLRRPIEFAVGMDIERGPGLSWRNMVDFLLRELAMDSALMALPEARRHIEELMMTTLLMSQQSTYSKELSAPAHAASPACVRRVEEYIAANPAQRVTLQTLAQVAGVSGRSLQESFRRFRNVSPMEFVTAHRLDLACAILEEGCPQDSVTDVALRCGFLHLGRFALQYKARFGKTPSEVFRHASGAR